MRAGDGFTFAELDPAHIRGDARGEPTGDPTPCDMGEHPDIEGGRCLICGEWVIG
jgi:hypothetical protein